jgi:flagellar hook-associated protein 1 FlgK
MSLSLAYQIARGSLSANATAASVVSRNIAAADDPSASSKTTHLVTEVSGGVRVAGVVNAVDSLLLEQSLESNSASSMFDAMHSGLDRLQVAMFGSDYNSSPSALLGKLRDALHVAASSPQDLSIARFALVAANDVALSLNRGASVVAETRAQADQNLRDGILQLNDLLNSFQQTNRQISIGLAQRGDVTDAIDQRNALLRDISKLVDVRASTRGDNEMVLFLASGPTLLETSLREITLDGPGIPGPGLAGPGMRVDGWPIENANVLGGKLGGLLKFRDDLALTFGRQLDEIARGLIMAAAESDQSAVPAAPVLAGLFTYAGGPSLPATGTVVDGIASSIRVNPNVDPAQGGSLARLRDGGISAPGNLAYVYNSTGVAGFGDRLLGLVERFSADQAFDAAARLGSTSSGLLAFASGSVGWLEEQRSSTQSHFDDAQVLADRSLSAWQNRVGISIDSEMTTLISLERSYQASSRLITSVNSMFDSLLRAVG